MQKLYNVKSPRDRASVAHNVPPVKPPHLLFFCHIKKNVVILSYCFAIQRMVCTKISNNDFDFFDIRGGYFSPPLLRKSNAVSSHCLLRLFSITKTTEKGSILFRSIYH